MSLAARVLTEEASTEEWVWLSEGNESNPEDDESDRGKEDADADEPVELESSNTVDRSSELGARSENRSSVYGEEASEASEAVMVWLSPVMTMSLGTARGVGVRCGVRSPSSLSCSWKK